MSRPESEPPARSSPDRAAGEEVRRWLDAVRAGEGPEAMEDVLVRLETYLDSLLGMEAELRERGEALRRQRAELESTLEDAEHRRRRYRTLFDHALFPFLVTDRAGLILEANLEAGSLMGVDPSLLEGTPIDRHLVLDAEARARVHGAASDGPLGEWETEIRPATGAPIPVEVSVQALDLADPEGDRTREVHWVIRDLRPRLASRERERELQRQQAARNALERVADRARFLSGASARLTGLLEPAEVWRTAAEIAGEHAAASLLLELDPAGERVTVRAAGGVDEARAELDPVVGRTADLDGPDLHDLPIGTVRSAVNAGEPEVVPAPEDPPDSLGACIVVPLRAHHRTLGAMVLWLRPEDRIGEELLVARSLADRIVPALEAAELFQEVIAARSEAEAATAAEADFLSVVSHELRTPLTAIISYAELLEERAEEMPENLGRYARQMAAAAEHQRQLVEQILSYRQTQREGGVPIMEKLDYRKVARSAVAMVAPRGGQAEIDIVANLPDAPVQGVSDRGKLQQILVNLLSNALRHTTQGRVVLTLEAADPWVVVSVSDTGSGIAPADLPRIFDRFFRGAGSPADRGGSGLGLTITRELVTGLGGEIEVESELGVGTTFTVRLPRTGRTDLDRPVVPDLSGP